MFHIIHNMPYPDHFWETSRFLIVFSITLIVILLGSWYKMRQLKQGGGHAVAKLLGGKQLKRVRHPLERQLRNVVEEMAVASGVLTPAIYILDQRGINAFAAGYEAGNTVIAVTKGCMEMLSRDELQGVIAHEFSHILHGDTIIKMKMMGLLHGITMVSDLGILMIAGRYSKRYSTNGRVMIPLVMLSGICIFSVGLLGMLAADFIKAALSRQREYLADASAVQFTRNPEGIAGALQTIGGYKEGSRLSSPEVKQVSHLFFGDALKDWRSNDWWASHPPLLSRIQRIQPYFRGKISRVDAQSVRFQNEQYASSMFSPAPSQIQVLAQTQAVMQQVGNVQLEQLEHAQRILNSIPDAIREHLYDAGSAKAVLYYLLLSNDKTMMNQQFQHISKEDSPSVLAELIRVRQALPKLKIEQRLPLLDLLSP
ncbi:MAG: M48 family metallopeptidase, partial [Mariprofundaceae bacterium]|nr:M48 family metallopeptidase [Mariprofundaceae bacterium]